MPNVCQISTMCDLYLFVVIPKQKHSYDFLFPSLNLYFFWKIIVSFLAILSLVLLVCCHYLLFIAFFCSLVIA